MHRLSCIFFLISIYFITADGYVQHRVKREVYVDVMEPPQARRGFIKLTDKLKFAVANSLNVPEQEHHANKSLKLSDFFDDNGMLFLSPPQYNEGRILNKAMNKALAMKNAGLSSVSDAHFSPEELQMLNRVVAGLSGLRNKDEPNIEFSFNELVA